MGHNQSATLTIVRGNRTVTITLSADTDYNLDGQLLQAIRKEIGVESFENITHELTK